MKRLIGIEETPSESDEVKKMSQMQPLEVCVVVEGDYKGEIIMRTACKYVFEIIDLTNPAEFWDHDSTLKVRPCKLDSITLKLG